jgi:NADH:ubiquinone oxidoreductase subunit 5 (subunit L)/multisubunit Na+/H+ antiporter MnhA subunit
MPHEVELHVPHVDFGLKSQAWGLSALLLAAGIISGKTFYWNRKVDEWDMERTGWRAPVYKFLWNRWYMNPLFYRVFVDGFINLGRNVHASLEKGLFDKITPVVSGFFINLGINLYSGFETEVLDEGINVGIPSLFTSIYNHLKKLQTGVLSYNIAYMAFIFLVLIIVLMIFGGMI